MRMRMGRGRCEPGGGANHEEVRETHYWLRLILRAKLVDRPHELKPLVDECGELIAILTASARTARSSAAPRN